MSNRKFSEEDVLLRLSKENEISIEELKKELEEIVLEVRKDERFSNATEETAREIARNRLTTTKRRELLSPAITWKGIVLGIGDLVDTVQKVRRLTNESYEADPTGTLKGRMHNGVLVVARTKEEYDPETKESTVKVIPLYPKTTNNDKWKRSLTPIPEHSWLRNIFGVASPIDKKTRVQGEPRVFSMVLNQPKIAKAGNTIPLMKPIAFKGIDKTDAETAKAGEYKINSSSFTEFKLDPSLQLPPLEDILVTNCIRKFVQLGDLEQYFDDNEKDQGRWCITQGTVSNLDLEPNTKTGNMRMTLDDESLLFSPTKDGKPKAGVQCWIPNDRKLDLEFGQDSRVYVVARANRGKAYDRETRQQLDEPGEVNLNVYGIYVPDIYRIVKEDSLPEDSLLPEEEIPSEPQDEVVEEGTEIKKDW